MTRKSQGRMQRDKLQKELTKLRNDKMSSKAWDNLREHHEFAMQQIKKFGSIGHALLEHKHLIPFLINPEETNDTIRTITKDLKKFKTMFDNINDQHKQRTGRPTSNDDLVLVIDFTKQYTDLMESLVGVVEPMTTAVTDDFQVAKDRHDIATGEKPRAIAEAMSSNQTLTLDQDSGKLVVVPYANAENAEPDSVTLVEKEVPVTDAAPAESIAEETSPIEEKKDDN